MFFLTALTFRTKKFLQTLLTLVNRFVFILKNALLLAAFRTNQISRRNTLFTPNFISNIVERFFQRIKIYRHIATRYDKLALCFENFVLLASSRIHF
ncbi:MAG: transposase [Selenomonadaceae bacterium]|nr:transposase [Selenomonadaceae bacterium]